MIPRTDSRTLSPGFSDGGFSRTDLVMMLGAAGLLMAVVLPALSMQRSRSDQVACAVNLHRLGQAFQAFAESHDSQFPFRVPRAYGGSEGFSVVSPHFGALSNYLASPRILACPASGRVPANSFGGLKDASVSYLLGVHAVPDKQRALLAADFDVTGGSNAQCAVAGRILLNSYEGNPGLPDTFRPASWSGTNHVSSGNVLWSDGSVSSGDSQFLRVALSKTRLEGDNAVHLFAPK